MAKRRMKGEGGISEYRKGHFRAYLDLGKDQKTGRRIRKTFTGSSKQEVIEKLNKAKYEKQEGLLTINSKTPLRVFVEHWWALKEKTVRPTTLDVYNRQVKKFILPYLGDMKLSEIKPVHLNDLFTNKMECAQSVKVITRAMLYNIFKLAVREELIPNNPVERMEPLRTSRSQMNPLTPEEIQTLLKTAKSSPLLYNLIRLAIETGLRRGELFALHWSDIDFKESTITVRHALSVIRGTQMLSEPKTDRSLRVIAVSPDTLRSLTALKKPNCDIVFSNRQNTYCKIDSVMNQYRDCLKKAGIEKRVRFHDLRHTNATLLIAAGVNMKTVSERLGHSSITITLDRYTHAVKEEDRKAAKIMSDLV